MKTVALKKIKLFFIALSLCSVSSLQAQYVEPEEKDKVTELYPEVAFDSVYAKSVLAKGTGKITGVAFTRPRTKFGYKAPLADKIKASKITVQLFPVTPYLESWLELRKKKENRKKKVYVYMSPEAFRYRLEAVTNSEGKFTFPDMKPGKYFLTAIMDYSLSKSYDAYTGSGYNNYGGRTDYYERKQYFSNHAERLEEYVEVKSDGEVVKVTLK
ncbi:MAG: hypothetical protein P0Y53_16385 [Candidatus Pseudobacter hemicellulosilyticus]|uniref:Carboxypeptidase regulatory-like domain-containing protein n=1 Tax=Candidatus Pseudobacter hemicellulosilyticus TaxID=3121375 RepID=A0AAJ5WNQ3_9BACT|nr:MAG: hypothetical protein P0Y53_16385 [Pseudobacter sp.]